MHSPISRSSEPMKRRRRSESLLGAAGVRLNLHLPPIMSSSEIVPRSVEQVAGRLLALTAVATKGEGLSQQDVDGIIEDYGIGPHLSPLEVRFIADPHPSERDRIQFTWRYECAWIMLWALRLTDRPLDLPLSTCDVRLLATTIRETGDRTANGLRSSEEIADETDLIYRCHWATRQSDLDGIPPGGGLERGVTMERHHALNWLAGVYGDDPWDEVGTDT